MDLLNRETETLEQESAAEAGGRLASYVDEKTRVGDLLSLDYSEAIILVHDALRQEVRGLPMGCFLLATRIAPETKPDANEEDTALILLRVIGHSSLPNRTDADTWRFDAARRSIDSPEQWDADKKTDQFTLNQLRHAGVRCSVLGTFRYVSNGGSWNLTFGADISNFYSGQGMKVYKPVGTALSEIVNFTKPMGGSHPLAGKPVPVGRVRYSSSEITVDQEHENVSVHIEPTDMLARRTALFGMSRSGKSNTIKTVASAIFNLRKIDREKGRVGQLIFDPNGEYANENPQDQGCLRNVANTHADFQDDVVTYGLQPHPNDPRRNITKFNFFGDTLPQSRNPSKEEMDEVLHSLYQGKQIINTALQEESGAYIRSFVNADITAPPDADDFGVNTRYRRALFVYKSVLAAAGFERPENGITTKDLFNAKIRKVMLAVPNMRHYATHMENHHEMSWDMAQNFCRAFSEWVKDKTFKDFDTGYAEDRNWSDDRFLGLLRIFENTRGLTTIQQTRQWHGLNSTTDYAEDIINHIRAGRLVIFDQALGDPDMNEQAAARIMRGLFRSQQQAFVDPETDEDTGEIKAPPPVIIYVEEAHTLLPKGSEADLKNIWARIAKEGSKFNIGLVYSTQEPSTIQANILKNTDNWFVAHLNNQDETRELKKYYDFEMFVDQILKVPDTGFLRMRCLSNPYIVPVQINKFTAELPGDREVRQEFPVLRNRPPANNRRGRTDIDAL